MRVFISGITGFLGSQLAECFLRLGHAVAGSARDAQKAGNFAWLKGSEVVSFSLGEQPTASMFEGCDTFVHCAHEFGRGSLALNAAASQSLYHAAQQAGVQHQIYMSSYSARPDSLSEYGRTKYLVEQHFLERGETVVRPGLVVGNGGMFLQSARATLRTPLIPLLNGGRNLVPIIGVSDFVLAVETIAERRLRGAYNLFNPDQMTMRELLDTVKQCAGHRALYLPINSSAAVLALRVLRKLGLRLPVDEGNVRAVDQNQGVIHLTDLPELLPEILSNREAIGRALKGAAQIAC